MQAHISAHNLSGRKGTMAVKRDATAYLDTCWATVLGCSVSQLRDGGRHIVGVPPSTGGLKRPWPLRQDSIVMLSCGKGWVLSVPSSLRPETEDLCLEKPLADIAAEGDAQAEQWWSRGAKDEERQAMRGTNAYPTLARLAEGLPVRGWSHHSHWYCDPDTWDSGKSDSHVRLLKQDDPEVWAQWRAWEGDFCQARFSDKAGFFPAFGYVLDGQLVSVAQVQADRDDFAWGFGVDTLPQSRRRGFATTAARAATRWIRNQGKIPWYYYDHYNRASAAIPGKLRYFLYAEGLFSHMRQEG